MPWMRFLAEHLVIPAQAVVARTRGRLRGNDEGMVVQSLIDRDTGINR